jgi:hypothetical protein
VLEAAPSRSSRWSPTRIAFAITVSPEDLPLSGNRVTLERDGGIRLAYTPTNDVPKQMLYDRGSPRRCTA